MRAFPVRSMFLLPVLLASWAVSSLPAWADTELHAYFGDTIRLARGHAYLKNVNGGDVWINPASKLVELTFLEPLRCPPRRMCPDVMKVRAHYLARLEREAVGADGTHVYFARIAKYRRRTIQIRDYSRVVDHVGALTTVIYASPAGQSRFDFDPLYEETRPVRP